MSTPPSFLQSRRLAITASLLALATGVLAAIAFAWTTDDAFISFRYAQNLVEGNGLVFNVGERVEGYTNFLWTLWIAVGLELGIDASAWSWFWGIVAYAGVLALLIAYHFRLRRHLEGILALPVAALIAAFHQDWTIFATSGLETSLYTFLLLAGYMLVVTGRLETRRLLAAGLTFGLANLTRPDGVIPASVAGLYVLTGGRARPTGGLEAALRRGLVYGGAFVAVWGPFMAWRYGYYGDYFPNTYYAKSAWLPWYDQGWHYITLYFQKYWNLLTAVPLAAVLALRLRSSAPATRRPAAITQASESPAAGDGSNLAAGRSAPPSPSQPAAPPGPSRSDEAALIPEALLALAIALAYTFYIVRVGGDFMFARVLIPATPFYLIPLELGVLLLSRRRLVAGGAATALLLAGMVYSPTPVTAERWAYGITNEWLYYSLESIAEVEHRIEVFKKYFDGLPMRMVFYGREARLVYEARVPIAIEGETGLTDRTIARQPLKERGRVGHEKRAQIPYLVDERHVHFVFMLTGHELLQPDRYLPMSLIALDDIHGRILYWDPGLLEALKQRGAVFRDFPTELDRYLARLDALPTEQVAQDYPKFQRFYFNHVADPAREAPIRRRLGLEPLP